MPEWVIKVGGDNEPNETKDSKKPLPKDDAVKPHPEKVAMKPLSKEKELKSLAISVKKLIYPEPLSKCCISKVPKSLREVNEKAYDPTVVSIGPLHRGKDHLKEMEQRKAWHVHSLLNHMSDFESCLGDMIKAVKELEEDAKFFYDGVIKLSSEFVSVMVLDGCFMLDLFLSFNSFAGTKKISTPGWMHDLIRRDMLLLENQLPFIVLHCLYSVLCTHGHQRAQIYQLSRLVMTFFEKKISHLCTIPLNFEIEGEHILEMIYRHITSSHADEGKVSYASIPCAFDLCESGVKFKRKEKLGCSITDITFKQGVLEIPLLEFYDDTESFIRNLVAFEHSKGQDTADGYGWVTTYASLLDDLINTENDVKLICHEGIIHNHLGSDDELANVINKLGTGSFKSLYYNSLRSEVAEYHKKRRHRWRAAFMRNYCDTPWTITSVIAAIMLLIFTLVQTFFSVFSYDW